MIGSNADHPRDETMRLNRAQGPRKSLKDRLHGWPRTGARATDFPAAKELPLWENSDGQIGEGKLTGADRLEAAKLWNDERKWMEELSNQRLTFLETIFGAIVAGVIALREPRPCFYLLAAGSVICVLLALPVQRGYATTSYYTARMIAAGYMPIKAKTDAFDRKQKQDAWFRGVATLSLLMRWTPNALCVMLAIATACAGFGACGYPDAWPFSTAAAKSSPRPPNRHHSAWHHHYSPPLGPPLR